MVNAGKAPIVLKQVCSHRLQTRDAENQTALQSCLNSNLWKSSLWKITSSLQQLCPIHAKREMISSVTYRFLCSRSPSMEDIIMQLDLSPPMQRWAEVLSKMHAWSYRCSCPFWVRKLSLFLSTLKLCECGGSLRLVSDSPMEWQNWWPCGTEGMVWRLSRHSGVFTVSSLLPLLLSLPVKEKMF